jgi:hypothetical protein
MCAVVVVVLNFLGRPLLFVDLLAPNKEKKMLFSFVTKQKPPTLEFLRCTKDMYDQNWR